MKIQYRVFFSQNGWCSETTHPIGSQYVQGYGKDQREAINNMKKKISQITRAAIDYEQVD